MEIVNITFVDLETTGLNSEMHEITEFGAVKTRVEERKLIIEEEIEFKVLPRYPINPFVAELNGYNQDDWDMESVDLPLALGETFRLMRNSWFAGSNPKFDDGFLRKAAAELHWDYPKLASYHLVDVSMLAFPLLLERKVEGLAQAKIAKYYNIEGGGHRALPDAIQCAKIFAKITNLEYVPFPYVRAPNEDDSI